jgi:D-lyxose ketol-isomerase
LWVKTDIGPDNERNITKIGPEQSFTVPPGVTHEFRTGEWPAIIEEIAYVEYDSHDIDRKLLGGNIEVDDAYPEVKVVSGINNDTRNDYGEGG